MLAEELKKSLFADSVWKTFRNELLEKYREFHVVGGMPSGVRSSHMLKRTDFPS